MAADPVLVDYYGRLVRAYAVAMEKQRKEIRRLERLRPIRRRRQVAQWIEDRRASLKRLEDGFPELLCEAQTRGVSSEDMTRWMVVLEIEHDELATLQG